MRAAEPNVPRKRLVAYYLALAAFVVAGAIAVFAAGSDKDAQPPIAGGYDVGAGSECLGKQVDLRQSGQFISAQRPDGESAGKLRLHDPRLTGTVQCIAGGERELVARVRAGIIAGTLGAAPLRAEFKRDPPPPGSPAPARPALARRQLQAPATLGLPGRRASSSRASGRRVELKGRDRPRRRAELRVERAVSGEARCARGG